ncbi:MAG: zinc ribbon domain-containing protein [Treponema sp.]|nr:zinc ribbon domain-containing protein [Treponema sp.]
MVFCQSRGMPLGNDKDLGTNAGGSKNKAYRAWCYGDGKFTQDAQR